METTFEKVGLVQVYFSELAIVKEHFFKTEIFEVLALEIDALEGGVFIGRFSELHAPRGIGQRLSGF